MIALFWALLAGDSMLLLEEPELSLNDAIVAQIPLLIDRIKRQVKYRRQVLVTTHSEAMLGNPIDGRSVLLVTPTDDGSEIRGPDEQESALLTEGLLPSEVLLPKARPKEAEHLGLFK